MTHTDYTKTGNSMKNSIVNALDELSKMSAEELRNDRYNKFRNKSISRLPYLYT